MFSETDKRSTTERLEAVVQLIYENETVVMGNAALTQELWERMMAEDMLANKNKGKSFTYQNPPKT